MSQALQMFNSAGPEQFTKMVCGFAPYFNTIQPLLTALRPEYAEAEVPFRKEITNHVGSVHAIAMCNAAELVAGVMTDVSVPEGARWLPTGMTVSYLAKAKSDLRAVADGSELDWESSGEKLVPVDVFDADGNKVFTARITINVKQAR